MTPIPFEPQQAIDGSRTCGAAALTMVYRSLGTNSQQLAVWHRVAEEIRPGTKATRTHRLALDARQSGYTSVVLQAERPAALLLQLIESDIRVILNHRLDRRSHLGHYSVLLRFDGDQVEIHDPHRGPNRVLPWAEFEELWQPDTQRSEIVGRVLVAIGTDPGESRSCRNCCNAVPTHWTCARCGQLVPIGPAGAVRCVTPACSERLWSRLFCPHCDRAETNPGQKPVENAGTGHREVP